MERPCTISFTPGHATALLSRKLLATSLKNTPENVPTKKTCPGSISWVAPALQELNIPRYLPCFASCASAVTPKMHTSMSAPSPPTSALRCIDASPFCDDLAGVMHLFPTGVKKVH